MAHRRPNFLFIGPDKSGSTWLYEVLAAHPEVFLPSTKELFFFDFFYERGWDWYMRYFTDAPAEARVIGEISHDYLYSVEACQRIRQHLPEVRLMACLRDPAERAFSSYLYMIKQGRTRADFATALREIGELTDHGRYATHLLPYLDRFDRNHLHIAVFDDLAEDPQRFFDAVCAFLGIAPMLLREEQAQRVLPAAAPRSYLLARIARRAGWALRLLGAPTSVSRIKKSLLLNRLLYRPYAGDEKPKMSSADREYLRSLFRPEVLRLDELFGLDLASRWGYADDAGVPLSRATK